MRILRAVPASMQVLIFSFILANLFSVLAYSAEPSFNSSFIVDSPSEAYRIENSFSSSCRGINGVSANPAGIARSSTFEISLGLGSHINSDIRATLTVSDKDLGTQGDDNFFFAGLYFTDDPTDTSTNEFKTRDVNGVFDYQSGGGITDLGVAFNFGDVFAFGIQRMRPSILDMNVGGYAPTIFKNTMDMRGQTVSGLTIEGDGRAVFTGSGTSFATSVPLYKEFTYHSTDAAFSTAFAVSNQVVENQDIALTIGGKVGDLMWGVSAIPIESTINLNNSAFTVTGTNSANMVYYVPGFDPGSPESIINWADETNQIYSREAGYKTFTVVLSPESFVYSAEAIGNYSASAMRVDLGLIWQPFDSVSISLAYENIGGANLVYKGKGVATAESYINVKDPPTMELGKDIVWNPLSDTPGTLEGAEGFYLPDSFTIVLPRKGRVGISFTKPFFFAVDYERYFTDLQYQEMTVQDLGFLRVGLESQIFFLPLVFRTESRWLIKPTILGITDPAWAKDINDFLDRFPAVPTETTFGVGWKAWGGEMGADFTENHASILSVYEGDLLDFLKTLSYDVYLKTDNWDVTYTAIGEPFYLISENAELINKTRLGETITASDVKTNWVYTLKFGFRF